MEELTFRAPAVVGRLRQLESEQLLSDPANDVLHVAGAAPAKNRPASLRLGPRYHTYPWGISTSSISSRHCACAHS